MIARLKRPSRKWLAGAFVLALTTACSTVESPTSVSAIDAPVAENALPEGSGYVRVCKVSGPAGTYSFNVSVAGGGDYLLPNGETVSLTFDGTTPTCLPVYNSLNNGTWAAGQLAQVTVSENVPVGMNVAEIQVLDPMNTVPTPGYEFGYMYSVYNTNTITVSVTVGDRRKLHFYNVENPPPPPPPPGYLDVCKVGGPAGTYTFNVNVVGGGAFVLPAGPNVNVAFDGSTPSCVTVYTPNNYLTWPAGTTASVEITEINLPENVAVQSITVVFNGSTGSPITNTTSTDVTMGFTDIATVRYTNILKPPPRPLQGCTPGYWKVKQHHDSWVPTGYTTGQAISTVFTVPATLTLKNKPLGNYTLLQGLSFQGGNTLSEKAEILLRAAIAGLLNSANGNVNYAMYTTGDLINAVNAALASGDADQILTLATKLDDLNNAVGGCPLD